MQGLAEPVPLGWEKGKINGPLLEDWSSFG